MLVFAGEGKYKLDGNNKSHSLGWHDSCRWVSRGCPPYRLPPTLLGLGPTAGHGVTARPPCASGAELRTPASRAFVCLSQALNSHLFIPIFQKRQQTLLPHKANRNQHILGRPSLTDVCAHAITKYSRFQRLPTSP